MEDPSSAIFILFILLILSGFFSGAEIALFSLSAEKIRAAKKTIPEKKLKQLERLEKIKKNPHKLLVTILICNNVVNVASSSMATLMASQFAATQGIDGNSSLVIGLVTGIMTFLILMFGEITPKAFAHKHAFSFSLISAPILQFLKILLYPIVTPLAMITRKFAGQEDVKHGLSEAELKAAIELSEAEGTIEHEEKELFEKVLEFDEHDVESVMTPRSKVKMIANNVTIKEAIDFIHEVKLSRIPVYDSENYETIVGVLTVHSLIDSLSLGIDTTKTLKDVHLADPFKIPPTMRISTLRKTFQKEKTSHMALVYDEHGGFIGLITMEDVLEEIFGEILDENDQKEFHIKKLNNGTFSLESQVELEHIEEALHTHLQDECPETFPWSQEDENDTLKYFLIEQIERFPKAGEIITSQTKTHDFIFTVKSLNPEKETIKTVILDLQKRDLQLEKEERDNAEDAVQE